MRYLLTLAIVLSSCKWQREEASVAQVKNTQDISGAVSAISGEHVCHEKLNVANMQVDFLGAGVQTTLSGRFVRLYFNASLCRDYLEIMRCYEDNHKELQCRDGKAIFDKRPTEDLQKRLENPSGDTVNRAGLRDCWNSIASNTNSGCVLLGAAKDSAGDRTGRVYAAEHFIDAAAPAGRKFFYLARACVHAERADELTSGNATCSHQLTRSNTVTSLEHYTLNGEVLKARERVASIAARLNYMTDEAYRITLQFSKAMDAYQEAEIERQRGKALRQGIAMIGGMIVGAVGAVCTVGVDSVGSGLDAGQALGAAFADIIASQDDYAQTCYECMRLRADLMAVIGDTRGQNLTTSGLDLLHNDDEKEKAAGLKYHQALADYGDAIKQLKELQDEHGEFIADANTLDDAGSKGGPQ